MEGVRFLLHMGQTGYVSTTHGFLLHSTLNTTVRVNGSDGTAFNRLFFIWHTKVHRSFEKQKTGSKYYVKNPPTKRKTTLLLREDPVSMEDDEEEEIMTFSFKMKKLTGLGTWSKCISGPNTLWKNVLGLNLSLSNVSIAKRLAKHIGYKTF